MQDLLDSFSGNPLLAAGALALCVLVLYALLKKLFKVALFLLLLLAAVLVWFKVMGHELPDELGQVSRTMGKVVKQAGKTGGELLEDAGKEISKKVDDAKKDAQ